MLEVCLLGCGGTKPLPDRWLTSLLAKFNGKMILIDCGEGTQITLQMLGWGMKSIEAICFTHYHADHVVGLPGLLLSIGNAGRTEPLLIMGPPGLKEVVQGLTVIAPRLPFPLHLLELSPREPDTLKVADVVLHVLPVLHTVPCLSYGIEIERGRKFDPEKARTLNIPVSLWKRLQNGEEISVEDRLLTPDMVLGPPRRGIKVCYCTDTRPIEELVGFIENADLFVCEGMYGEEEKRPNAEEHKHMLFSEAAFLASRGGVKELWLTHYSPSLADPENYLGAATTIFPNTKLGKDRMTTSLHFEK